MKVLAETGPDNAASIRLLTQDRLLSHRASADPTQPDRVHASMKVPVLTRSRQDSPLNGAAAGRQQPQKCGWPKSWILILRAVDASLDCYI